MKWYLVKYSDFTMKAYKGNEIMIPAFFSSVLDITLQLHYVQSSSGHSNSEEKNSCLC
jgi:hypothetical protein